jgi:hypothetical protein
MPIYTSKTNVTAWLKGYAIGFGSGEDYNEIDYFIDAAEQDVDAMAGRGFGLERVNQILSGRALPNILLTQTPVIAVDKIEVRVGNLIARAYTDNANDLVINRKSGKVSITPLAQFTGAVYENVFSSGDQNVFASYWRSEHYVGDNIDVRNLAAAGFAAIMTMGTTGSNTTFTLPRVIGNVGWKMLKASAIGAAWTDDTANWTLSGRTFTILTANFAATSVYRLSYIPKAIETAATMLAAGNILMSLAGKDDCKGGAGAQGVSVSGFSENYGQDGKWGAQIGQWRDIARREIERFRQVGVGSV